MANVYLNTGALSLYSSANGTDWAQMSGSSPYTLAVNTYYKLTATPPSGQILAKWTLENNTDNIITLSNNYTPETIFNTLEQTWDYTEDKTIIITPTYVNEDNEYLNKRGLKDVVERLAKVEPIAQNNTKNKTFYTHHEWVEDAEDPLLHQRLEALAANNWALLRNTRRNPEEQDLMSMIEAQGISINDRNALTSFFLRWLESANAEDLLTIFNGANPPEGRVTVFENPDDDVVMKWPNSDTNFSLNWLYKKGEWNNEYITIFPYGYLAQVHLEEDTELDKFVVVAGECWQAPRADTVFLHHNDYDYHFALQTDLTKYLLEEDIDGYLPTETDVINSSTTYELPTASAVKNYVTSQGYVTTDTDTKNTAGATDTSSRIYLIGATSQAANPQTYSDNEVFVKDGVLNTQELTVGSGQSTGMNSFSQGNGTTASGLYTHAEGNNTIASGEGSHAEGFYSQALGDYSHAEGIGQSSSPSQTTVTVRSHTIPSSDDNDESVINVLASWNFLGGYFKFNNHYFYITNFTRASDEMPYYNCTIKPGFTISEAQSIIDNTTTLEVIYFGQNLLALGECSHAEGGMSQAIGMLSHAEGAQTTASGAVSHAEGQETVANADCSHAEGRRSTASGKSSHAEGQGTTASANCSHAEGGQTIASGVMSHAEGQETVANADCSHAEGYRTTASSYESHAEGAQTTASGYASHAEGFRTIADGANAHAEGIYTYASGRGSHAEGACLDDEDSYLGIIVLTGDANATTYTTTNTGNVKIGYYIKSPYDEEGAFVTGITANSSITLNRTLSTSAISNEEYYIYETTIASGEGSHAEGQGTIASGKCSHAGGWRSTASKDYSYAQGSGANATGQCSHAEGQGTTASNNCSHAEGYRTTASGYESHAEGSNTTASGYYSHAEGYYTTAQRKSQHTQGEYNILDTSGTTSKRGTYAHIVGNGTSDSNRSNAATLDWSGNAWYAGDVYVGSTSGTNKDAGSKKLATEDYVRNLLQEFATLNNLNMPS